MDALKICKMRKYARSKKIKIIIFKNRRFLNKDGFKPHINQFIS